MPLEEDVEHAKPDIGKARFLNRKREKGWLPPSLLAHINQNLNLVRKLLKLVPLTKLSVEHVKFDTQLLQNEEIKGVEYQQGTLEGYEVREYLLEKWGRICAYCKKTNIPLQIEHIIPKSRGGSNRISNLTLACQKCNESKATKTASEFGFEQIQEQAKKPLKAAAFMNATRWNLYQSLKKLQLVVECGSGALTKRNRMAHKLPKTHYFDACCVGLSTPNEFKTFPSYTMLFKSLGRGNRQMCRTNKYGFPVALKTRNKLEKGFKTGDYVYAKVAKGKYEGNWRGIVAIRSSGYFDLKGSTQKRICQGVSYKYFTLLQLSNGWFLEKLPLNH